MLTLFHYPLSSASRFIRIILEEYCVATHLIEEHEWARRSEFLALNPAGHLPVLLAEREVPLSGAIVICEYLDETRGSLRQEKRFFPETSLERAEVRRLIDWFLNKFENEATRHIVRERIYKREMPLAIGGGAPNSQILRNARANIVPHMNYLNWLCASRDWLASSELSYADLVAAASVSVLDFLAEIDWKQFPAAREWYTRIKSRPSFRPLLMDRVRGIAPSSHYADLDF
ncbi:Glutathione S-transferase [Bartonella clarridgeiae 73]|uniref:Glutathione S-transferase n=1 Tax=Bartonella clarridgeiae (strain CCUG 45776 / CIP 104772 / 73) TaxID=696125 RepID=E6YGF6_BARC7|nr:glutathione S-transferase family protein [Bartonella clarridgeiae]WCR55454.1 MAG: Glutathione S-transferase family protein [Bartonella clarridgeiae]CBI75944.1 Glutathione S-transferase [Bartonella clarridgeiae 73]